MLDKSSGKVVGFKRDLNECPVSVNPPLFGEDTVLMYQGGEQCSFLSIKEAGMYSAK
ncbi:hypothetical protein CAEBREN_06364 [Caenorhabditis brenneri]|uniref:Uncharacterized protein n=1 Tax=Caenorhabditis brenneri TaxID=135651 RepID=G0PC40_CAEBE|nr:hypothetical protein CAEBREN_06364 [Caenorhabditis brenneri]